MKEICIVIFALSVLGGCSHATVRPKSADQYTSFHDLSAHETYGADYDLIVLDRNSNITIFAIHGGWIEPFTSEIADAIAGSDLNYYSFRGIKETNNRVLHITSHNYDEPKLLAMLKKSEISVSIHGMKGHESGYCIGGQNTYLQNEILQQTKKLNLVLFSDCTGIEGVHPNNVVNLPKSTGVQFEISMGLRNELKENGALLQRFAHAIRTGILNYMVKKRESSN